MKTGKTSVSPRTILAILLLGFGVPYIILKISGYTLVPVNRLAPAVMSSLITAFVVFLTIRGIKRRKEKTRTSDVLSLLMPVFAIIFVIGKAIGYDTDDIELYLLPAYACIVLLCGIALFFACVSRKRLRIGLGITYSVLLLPMFAVLLLWDFSPKPVVTAEVSPDGQYLAQIVRSDQGIFGRRTFVNVTRQGKDIQLPIGVLRKDPARVYTGEYEEHETITIFWETNEILHVNENKIILHLRPLLE